MIGWLRKLIPSGDTNANGNGNGNGNGQASGASRRAATPQRVDTGEPFVINLYDDRVVVHRPDGQREELAWDVLERVIVRVSNRAPWAGTAWLILVGDGDSKQGCVVPLDAANHAALLAHLRTLPGFSEQKLDNALRDAEAGRARTDANLWKRGDVPQAPAEKAQDAGDSHDPASHP